MIHYRSLFEELVQVATIVIPMLRMLGGLRLE